MNFDVIIIGAGVIGLAIAREVSNHGYSVVILEKESSFGQGCSSRNSEVVHAGIYYKTDSLKARLSIKGKELLYEFCEKYDVPYKKIGKLFIAVDDDEIHRLEITEKQALANGLDDLTFLNKNQLSRLEPELYGVSALLSPSSGIFHSHKYMETLLAIAEDNGALFSPNSSVSIAEEITNGWRVFVDGKNQEKFSITGRVVINSAGLFATKIAKNIFSDRLIPTLTPTKGCYLKYASRPPVKHIIYPAITPGKVEPRVDATPDLNGLIRFGPNVELPESLNDYKLNENLVSEMKSGILRYLPNIDESRLFPDFSGIRPKILVPGEDNPDFIFDWNRDCNWLDLFGIESPGLTSSLAVAEHVFNLFEENHTF